MRESAPELLLFRVGREYFALDLAAAEEVMELPAVERLPEMPDALLGVLALRGQLLPVYSPERALGVTRVEESGVLLVMRWRGRRVGIAIDDVEDVIMMEPSTVRRPPVPDSAANVLLGVARRGAELVGILDGDALLSACIAAAPMEAS